MQSGRRVALGAAARRRGAPLARARPATVTCQHGAAVASEVREFATGFWGGGGTPFGAFPGGNAGPPRGDSSKFYSLLDVGREASESDVKAAYKKQAMKHHPDRGGDETKFKEISRAYEVLSNPEKKQIYDTYGEEGLEGMEKGGGPGAGTMSPDDIFSSIFGFNVGGQRRGKPVTPDTSYELQLSLEELYNGATRSIIFNREVLCKPCGGLGGHDTQPCAPCNGTGQRVTMHQMGMFVQQSQSTCSSCRGMGYKVPRGKTCSSCKGSRTVKEKKTFTVDVDKGSTDGAEFRFKGQADEALGHDTGDVVIVLREKVHKTFQRTGDSLLIKKKISLSEALTGFEFSVPFLDGGDVVVRSEPGQVVRPGDILVVQGRGMPRPHGQRPGDLFLILDVEFPQAPQQHEDRQKLADLLGGGEVLSDEASPGAQPGRKLTQRQAKEMAERWSRKQQRPQVQECQQQ